MRAAGAVEPAAHSQVESAGRVRLHEGKTEVMLAGPALQTMLARAGFSPGLIDGKVGRKTKIAIEHLQRARGLEVTGEMNDETAAVLSGLAAGTGEAAAPESAVMGVAAPRRAV